MKRRGRTARPFKAAQAEAEHWGTAAKACLDGLGRIEPADNLGFIYCTADFAGDLPSILTFLRETTRIAAWVGAVGAGIYATGREYHSGGAVAVMVGALPPGAFHLFDGADTDESALVIWLAGQESVAGLIHGDPRDEDIVERVAALAEATDGFLVGGLTAAQGEPDQVAGRVTAAPLSGLLLGDAVALATGLSQGCTPIGAPHTVTEAAEGVVMSLDDRPALAVLREEAGELIGRDLTRAAGYIHAALPGEGDLAADYAVRDLLAIDPHRGWLAVAADLARGDRLLFVRRDPNAARTDLKRMLAGLRRRLGGNGEPPAIRGGVYISCVARGPAMFGGDNAEVEMIHDALGHFPLVGFSANGEICRDRLYAYTGVLVLFL